MQNQTRANRGVPGGKTKHVFEKRHYNTSIIFLIVGNGKTKHVFVGCPITTMAKEKTQGEKKKKNRH